MIPVIVNRCLFRARLSVNNQIHTCAVFANKRWRISQGYSGNKNTMGPLADNPDYTYLDGRPTPLGTRQHYRMLQQQELTKRMVELIGEVDFAVERHKNMQIESEMERNRIVTGRLKEKGDKLANKQYN